MELKFHNKNDFILAEEAANWFYTIQSANPAQQREFGAWLRESPRHVEEYLLVTATYRTLDLVKQDHSIDLNDSRDATVSRVVGFASGAAGRLSPMEFSSDHFSDQIERKHQGPIKPSRWTAMTRLVAAAIAAVAIGGLLWFYGANSHQYSTAIGEIRSVELPDGSLVDLNTRSQVAINFSEATRDIEFRAGEAIFKVAPDRRRPFRVRIGAIVVQAVGTQFNVYRRAQDTTIFVIEGAVQIASMKLTAGQGVMIPSNGSVVRPRAMDGAKVTAWRQRRLLFKEDLLTDVVTEFNRYNPVPQISVEGKIANSTRMSGIFDANDPESLLLFVADLTNLTLERQGDVAVIRDRNRSKKRSILDPYEAWLNLGPQVD